MDSLCDELSKHEYEDIVEIDYFFDTVNVEVRLKDHIQFWVNIQAPEFIVSIIAEGYKLPLLHIPPRSFTKNTLSAINNSVFVIQNQFSIYLLRTEYQKFPKIAFTLSIRCAFPLSLLVNVDSSWIYVLFTNLSLSKR